MNATPVDRPSSPSIQLMLLIIPTIQKIVSPAAIGPGEKRIGAPPERIGDEVDGDPHGDREAGQGDLAEQLDARPQVEPVVDRAEAGCERPASSNAATSDGREGGWDQHEVRTLVDEEEEACDQQKRRADSTSPTTSTGIVLTRRASGRINHPVTQDDGADKGVWSRASSAASAKQTTMKPRHNRHARDEGHRDTARDGGVLSQPSRGGQARHREAGERSRGPRPRADPGR